MRALFIKSNHGPHRCSLRYDDERGRRVERDFFAPPGGGYVREGWSDPRQVCDRLGSTGATLVWDPASGPLVELVRREWRAMRRAERTRRERW